MYLHSKLYSFFNTVWKLHLYLALHYLQSWYLPSLIRYYELYIHIIPYCSSDNLYVIDVFTLYSISVFPLYTILWLFLHFILSLYYWFKLFWCNITTLSFSVDVYLVNRVKVESQNHRPDFRLPARLFMFSRILVYLHARLCLVGVSSTFIPVYV